MLEKASLEMCMCFRNKYVSIFIEWLRMNEFKLRKHNEYSFGPQNYPRSWHGNILLVLNVCPYLNSCFNLFLIISFCIGDFYLSFLPHILPSLLLCLCLCQAAALFLTLGASLCFPLSVSFAFSLPSWA